MSLSLSAREDIRNYVRAGYLTSDEITERVFEMALEDEEEDLEEDQRVSETDVRRAVGEEIQALQQEQASWPTQTDYDKLQAIFASLESQGIVCREDFTCCMTCGFAEIQDEVEEARAAGKKVRGITFFHQQDTESAVEGGGVYLAYDSVEEGLSQEEVGKMIAAAIKAGGLSTQWDGDTRRRIDVALDWRRRWPHAA
jgi:hypothetical protein